jgi:23S rRNA (cytosine1962-C5)-methyltransferase
VLNLFSFSGGFSIAAGMGGAAKVTSVDVAAPAIEASKRHWSSNGLDEQLHEAVVADCFQFLEQSIAKNSAWDLVICDPPSFAPSQQTQANAIGAYTRLAQLSASVVRPGGLLALASCSSHIDSIQFTQCNLDGIGRSRRVAKLVVERGLPPDHPSPLAMPELKYLKFQLFQLN